MANKTTIHYCWNDHLIRKTEEGQSLIEDIEYAISTHYFNMFMSLRDKYNNVLIDLPPYAYELDSDKQVLQKIDITIPDNFNKIDSSDYGV